ncbi:hypothetical protein GGX14DRAFT_390189 [Mycena pura]|uniref:Uncharacterized protein n=1 Tax=Mycena pura TaxID=153505 RepID=A0AAD6YJA7_9AGAR|nr:hypothetical protein GGX14DRAFT_390189 [Mycena pura]
MFLLVISSPRGDSKISGANSSSSSRISSEHSSANCSITVFAPLGRASLEWAGLGALCPRRKIEESSVLARNRVRALQIPAYMMCHPGSWHPKKLAKVSPTAAILLVSGWEAPLLTFRRISDTQNGPWSSGPIRQHFMLPMRIPEAPLAAPALPAAPLIHHPPYLQITPLPLLPPTAPTLAAKQEQLHDDGFIIDAASASASLASLASASMCMPASASAGRCRMQSMMGVFRLNPRQEEGGRLGRGRVHVGGRRGAPAREPPWLFEFQVVLERLLFPEVTGDGEDDGGGRMVREAQWKWIPRWPGDAAGARRGWLLAFSPDFGLDAEASWSKSLVGSSHIHAVPASPRTRTCLTPLRRTRMRCTTLPHLLARTCATSPDPHAYVQSKTCTSAYEMFALHHWSLSVHAHAQGSSASLM